MDGFIVRSRLRWAEDGEKSNKYFLGLEKRNSRKKRCKTDSTDSGEEVTNPEDILNMQCEFYKNIYSSKLDSSCDDSNFFQCDEIPTLSNEDKLLCEGELSRVELNIMKCLIVCPKIKRLVMMECHLTFWNIVGDLLVNV